MFIQSQLDLFIYWITERMSIHNKRQAGEKKPWTNDRTLQTAFFTTPFRELDKTTHWFAKTIRNKLKRDPKVIFATIAFRWFNFIPSGELLISKKKFPMEGSSVLPFTNIPPMEFFSKDNLLLNWHPVACLERFEQAEKIVTGAFIVKTPNGMTKLEGLCQIINNVWKDKERLENFFSLKQQSLKSAWERIVAPTYPFLGPFMAYEVVTDLRHTSFLDHAHDKTSWCNIGPGAVRGLNRLMGVNVDNPPPYAHLSVLSHVLQYTQKALPHFNFEMREIEHSLCEFDKFIRVKNNEGKSKRTFNGR